MGLLSHVHWYLDLECKHCKQMNDRDDQQPLGIFILALSISYLLGWHKNKKPLPSPCHLPGKFDLPSIRAQDASSNSLKVQETSDIANWSDDLTF